MSRAKNAGKLVGAGLLILVAVIAMAVGTVAGLVRTSWGGNVLRRAATSWVDETLAGSLRVNKLTIGRNMVTVDGAELRDPDGNLVAKVARLYVQLSLRGLLRRELMVARVDVESPMIAMTQQASGPSNLARALRARKPASQTPAPEHTPAGPTGWTVRLASLRIADGTVTIARDGKRAMNARGINVQAAVELADREVRRFALRLHAEAQVEAMAATVNQHPDVPVIVDLQTTGDLAHEALTANGDLSLRVAESRLRARVHTESLMMLPGGHSRGVVKLTLEDGVLAADQLAWALPSLSPKVVLRFEAGASWDATSRSFTGNVDARAGNTDAAVKLAGALQPLRIDELRLSARHVDLARWLSQSPSSDLSIDLNGSGSGETVGGLRGQLEAKIPRGRIGNATAGPIRLTAQATPSETKVRVRGMLPGASLVGHGQLRGPVLAAHLRVRAHDLATTSRALTRVGARTPTSFGGRGWVRIDARGQATAPGLRVAAAFDDLGVGEHWARSIRLNAAVPDVRRPLFANATLLVPEARLDGRRMRHLALRIRSAGPCFAARLSLVDPERIHLAADGRWRTGRRAVELHRLDIGLERRTWHLQRPTVVAWHPANLLIDDLRLKTRDDQSLRLSLQLTKRTISGRLRVHGLELKQLPAQVLPKRLAVEGQLDADVEARGRWDNPRVTATALIHRGMIADRYAVEGTLDARVEDRRAAGRVHAAGLGGSVDGTFEVPLRSGRHAVASANLHLHSLALEDMAALVSVWGHSLPDMKGSLSGTVDVGGSLSRPALAVSVTGQGLVVGDCAIGQVVLRAESRPGSETTAMLNVQPWLGAKACAERIEVLARSELGLEMLVEPGAFRRRWMTATHQVDARIQGLDLAAVASLTPRPAPYAGRADLTASLQGSVVSPQLRTEARIAGLRSSTIPPTDGFLDVVLSRNTLTGHARIQRKGSSLLVLDARAHSPTSLLRRSSLGQAELRVRAEVGPLQFQHTSLSLVSSHAEKATLRGSALVVAEIDGTLAEPRANVDARVRDIRLGQKAWGDGHANVSYAKSRLVMAIDMKDRQGGNLRVRSTMAAGLGLAQILRPVAWKRLAASGHLEADELDLSALSAISPLWHDIAGKLSGRVAWSGPLADPTPSGWLKIRDGAVTVTGIGQYKNLHLSLRGDKERLSIEELRLSSGDGTAKLVGNGTRKAHGYAIEATIDVDKLPVYANGQRIAAVSVEASAKADTSSDARKAQIEVESARIAMNDGKRKKLVEPKRPGDVIVIREGEEGNEARMAAAGAAGAATKPSSEKGIVGGQPSVPVILVSAPRDLWLSGDDATIEVGLGPGFQVELSQPPRIYGNVVVRRGRIDVLGRRFDLKADSKIRFQGSPDAPVLDITAEHVNEQQQVTVLATIKGSPKQLTTSLTAPGRPDLTESQLYTLIVTGRLTFAQGPTNSAAPGSGAASVVGGLLAGELQKVVAKKLPLDVLTIEGGTTMGSARVEAGTYVTPDVYVGYVGRLGADPTLLQNRNAVHLEYLLGSHWSLQGEYGDAKAGSADVFWTNHY